jgi:histone acetyltransferase (RNA polymerase elongator complex component)
MDIDIEDVGRKFDSCIHQTTFMEPTEKDVKRWKDLVIDILKESPPTQDALRILKHKHGFSGKNSFLMQVFRKSKDVDPQQETSLQNILKIKKGKSHSGVLVITVFTSPYPTYIDRISGEKRQQMFSCQWNCAYCPNEPGQPRSYLKGEPGVMRANRNEFDPIRQMHDRMRNLSMIGHPVDKLEVLVLGGTWTSYPEEYREIFCRDLYYAANVFSNKNDDQQQQRVPGTLQEEKTINKTSSSKVIGLTFETRPDTINEHELKLLRLYGCTRVQLGIQHLDENVLKGIRRHCSTDVLEKTISILKDNAFKIDGHFMPNLPFSSSVMDREMFDRLLGVKHPVPWRGNKHGYDWETWNLSYPEVQLDQWKVYPCTTVPWTDIERWYRDGTYVPYSNQELTDVLLHVMTFVYPWIRLNRIIRDIPGDYIMAGGDKPNLRQELEDVLKKEGKRCACIRCREIKNGQYNANVPIKVREYESSGGRELFIAAESKDENTLYGFVRLRFPPRNSEVFPELKECALIRELHVYGVLQPVGNGKGTVQHKGIGKCLMNIAEDLTMKMGRYEKCAVIAAEGTKGYYEKLGYSEIGYYMIKQLT